MTRIDDLADAYYAARDGYEDLKAQATDLEKIMRAKERDLVDAMLDQQLKSFSRSDGTTVFLREHVNCVVIKANSEAIRKWLIAEIGDDKDFVEETVSKSAVTEFVKNRMRQGESPADFPAMLNVTTRPILNVKGWRGLTEENTA